jgi:mono/diheme cytochrome c family protein
MSIKDAREFARPVLVTLCATMSLMGAAPGFAAEPTTPLTPRQEQGRKLFNGSCVYCHGPNVWGTFTLGRRLGADHALLEQRTDLVAPYVKTVVRAGMGSMPAFRRTELSDAEVDAIVDYLTRANPSK